MMNMSQLHRTRAEIRRDEFHSAFDKHMISKFSSTNLNCKIVDYFGHVSIFCGVYPNSLNIIFRYHLDGISKISYCVNNIEIDIIYEELLELYNDDKKLFQLSLMYNVSDLIILLEYGIYKLATELEDIVKTVIKEAK